MRAEQVLLKAAKIIRRGWTQNSPARDAAGEPCGPRDKRAVCWCATGAIEKVCGGPEDGYEARYALRQVIGKDSIQDWNDIHARDEEEVAKIFEEAAKYAAKHLRG